MLLVDPAFPEVTEAWFDPAYWGRRARPVDAGGRGAAWFIEADESSLVLRQYRRGGVVARLSTSLYLFAGEKRVRSVAEFSLLTQLQGLGLPVPRPVAAWYQRIGLFYKAAIIIAKIPDSVTFGSQWRAVTEAVWKEIGAVIRRFHDSGVFHADLNCFNILLQGTEVYLIDFDKGWIDRDSSKGQAWKKANLERLHRSLSRQASSPGDESCLHRGWNALKQGYYSV
ncbi:MAG: 3-deoxy-D-manno-octulosonic acid kinase [Marinobacter sp.]|nr:3-deoxy-D-manno-octulosonic acid kinase [Marinobacter sp.]